MNVKYTGIDWLTMTSSNERVGQMWRYLYTNYKAARKREGDQEKNFHNGFYGGVRIASMSFGYSEVIGYIVVVSGSDAQRLFSRLQPAKHRVTRLDICADFLFEEPKGVAEELYLGLTHHNENKQRKFTILKNSQGGATFYLGSRQSAQFGRVYDKGQQAGTEAPGKLWRAEVEYKKPLAGSVARALAEKSAEDRQKIICDTVCDWFGNRGAELFPAIEYPKALRIAVEQRVTTADRKLAWLRTQVSPSIENLISAGYGKSVLNVLGLDRRAISQCLQEEA